MREHYHKKVNVLGIDVSVIRTEKAVNISMDLMRGKGLQTVFFLSAISSLYCKNHSWAEKLVQSFPLVLTGDRHTELAALHHQDVESGTGGIGAFADEYLKKLFVKLNREHRCIFAVMEQTEYLDSLKEYIGSSYPNIMLEGIVFENETEGESDKIVNEINADLPDIVFLCLPVEEQLTFVKEYSAMMNAKLCICISSIQPLIRRETEEIPGWIRFLHLGKIYLWMKKEEKIQTTIVGSIFKKKVLNALPENIDKEKSDTCQQVDGDSQQKEKVEREAESEQTDDFSR